MGVWAPHISSVFMTASYHTVQSASTLFQEFVIMYLPNQRTRPAERPEAAPCWDRSSMRPRSLPYTHLQADTATKCMSISFCSQDDFLDSIIPSKHILSWRYLRCCLTCVPGPSPPQCSRSLSNRRAARQECISMVFVVYLPSVVSRQSSCRLSFLHWHSAQHMAQNTRRSFESSSRLSYGTKTSSPASSSF